MTNSQIALLLIFAASGVAVVGTVAKFLRTKHRAIWKELFALRDVNACLHQELTELRKHYVINQLDGGTPLPARMTSQNGEDVLLWEFFQRKREGFYVDVGAYDGVGFSNTYFFECVGWRGILVEPNPELSAKCRSSRPNSRVINGAAGNGRSKQVWLSIAEGPNGVETLSFVGDNEKQVERIANEGGSLRKTQINAYTLNEILENHRKPIDFVSIDVEGSELDVLEGFDVRRFRPRVLVIEDNSNGRDTRTRDWLATVGYEERFRCEHNVFYTHETEAQTFQW